MSERIVNELERSFGREAVSVSRARFDGPELPLVAPASEAGFCEALLLARRERWVVVPCGLGSKLSWTRAPRRADFLLSSRAHKGVLAYEPGDGTLTARAGTTMAELAARVASGGHALTPDVPRPGRATLGGAIGAGESGSDRLRYGPLRDHVLGLQVALGDGTLARSGGRLVKNVTGYDLHRLFSGSHGTLCMILEASLRLFPLPEAESLITLEGLDRAEMLRLSQAVLDLDARPISITATRVDSPDAGGRWSLHVRLGGRGEVVAAERATLARVLPAPRVAEAGPARARIEALRDESPAGIDSALLRAEFRPSCGAAALDLLEVLLRALDSGTSPQPRWWFEPGLARVDLELGALAHDSERLARGLAELRAALAALGGRARLLAAPGGGAIDPFGEPTAGIELMRSIRERLDPARVFAAGRFMDP